MPDRRNRRALAATITVCAASLVAATGAPTGASARPDADAPVDEAASVAAVDGLTLDALFDPALEPARGKPRASDPHRSEPAPVPLRVDGELVPWPVAAVSALPGAVLDVVLDGADAGSWTLRHAAGEVVEASADEGRWRLEAPSEPGIYALAVEREGERAVRLNLLVLHPAEHVEGGSLHGFRIGEYATTPLGGRSEYLPPVGFVHVAPGDEAVLVSPHFALGQFLSKQQGEPRFLAFSEPLVRKLEAVLAKANEAGIETGTLYVMSGFRTPWYNRAIGNTTTYSRHLWGDAADVFVDRDGDGDMDDLNGDGRRDLADARRLAEIVEAVERAAEPGVRPGGIGLYRRNAAHGPFVHVDARGQAARW